VASRDVPQFAFKTNWTKRANAAPFERNEATLAVFPIGGLHFPAPGSRTISADKGASSASGFGSTATSA